MTTTPTPDTGLDATAADRLAAVEALAAPQWRSSGPAFDDYPSTVDAWIAGRNWMLDQIRHALTGQPVPRACECVCHNPHDTRQPVHGNGPCICTAYTTP